MRRKNKKKANTQSTKQEQRARFNTFKRRIFSYLKLFGCEEIARLFGDATFRFMYNSRNYCLPKVRVAKDIIVNRKFKNDIASECELKFSGKTIKINDCLTVSPTEVLTYFMIIDTVVKSKKDSSDINEILLVEKYLEKFPNCDALYDRANSEIENFIQCFGIVLTKMTSSLCWFKLIKRDKGSTNHRDILELNEYIPKKRMVMVDQHPRPVYPLCFAFTNEGPIEISVPAKKIKLSGTFDKKHVPVYVQNHLIHRLKERLDCLPSFLSEMFLFHSLKNPKFIYFKGRLLAEYNFDSTIKLGYILLEFLDGILLAKTFLLLSNIGTPEGEKLSEISGMKKFDNKYWAIDKLSTYHNSDLKDHPQTKGIFELAGCGDLFKELSYPLKNKREQPSPQAKQMLRYLDVLKEDEQRLVAV